MRSIKLSEMHIISKTRGAVQRNWDVPQEFPCCPDPDKARYDPMSIYMENLKEGSVFSQTDNMDRTISKKELSKDGNVIVVMSGSYENGIELLSITKITYEKGMYVHEHIGNFVCMDAADEVFSAL